MIIAVSFSNCKEAWKNKGFNGIRTRDLRDTGAMLYQLSYEARHTLGARSIYWVHISREEWNDVRYIWSNAYLKCECRWKWRISSQFEQLEKYLLGANFVSRASVRKQKEKNHWEWTVIASCHYITFCSEKSQANSDGKLEYQPLLNTIRKFSYHII